MGYRQEGGRIQAGIKDGGPRSSKTGSSEASRWTEEIFIGFNEIP